MTGRRKGALATRRGTPVPERLWFHSWPDDSGCVLWTSTIRNGYGALTIDGRLKYAHRLSYELAHGPIPDGLVIDHLCRVRRCINPDHLEPVTHAENIRRIPADVHHNGSKTHCPQGHPYSPENTYVRPTLDGGRECRACKATRARQTRKEAA